MTIEICASSRQCACNGQGYRRILEFSMYCGFSVRFVGSILVDLLSVAEFEEELEDYVSRHPRVKLCDPPQKTFRLRNRSQMLDIVPESGFVVPSPEGQGALAAVTCSVPSHTVLEKAITFDQAIELRKATKLEYPIIAKSLWADGRPGSHAMAVVWSGVSST